jgi:mono/diheme cytochrome c family protein
MTEMCRKSVLALWGILAAAQIAGATDADVIWSSKIQPLLDVNCTKCHGVLQQKSGLELDTIESLLKGGDDGAVIVPGKPKESRLYNNLASDAEQHMPPKKQLTEADRNVIGEWISSISQADAKPAPNPRAPRHFDSVTQAIDTLIAEGWQQRKVKPAPEVDDRTWCRRIYLDLVGRICTPTELQTFLGAPEDSKREALVDRLLASDEYPVRMRELWDYFLMGRPKRERTEDQRKKNGWWAYLENGFRNNRPWNDMVHAILVARPAGPEDQGASWFLYERRDDYQAIAEAVAPVVYGTKINCAQCHDHPLAREIKQAHYWGLVVAYNRCKNVEGGSNVAESAVGGFVNFTNLKKESQPAVITLLSGGTIKEDRPAADQKEEDRDDNYVDPKAKARVPKFSRRAAFADAATQDNPLLARAFVNRMWSALLGRGIVQPADEMNARNAPSHPELLDWLAQDFATNKYDVRREVKGIVLSRVYALGSAEAPPETFAGAIERSLSAEQLARSWRIAAGLPPQDDDLRRATITALPDVLPKDYNATYQQAQFLANSSVISEILKPKPASTITRLTAMRDPTVRVREAFLATYDRLPDAEEAGQAKAFLKARSKRPLEADRDLLWAMMTSAEFLTMP